MSSTSEAPAYAAPPFKHEQAVIILRSAYAAAPFDHEKADIILRSSDNIDFRVFKLFLSLASPFFESLFDIPQPTEGTADQTRDGLVVISVTEDSKTLDALLRFCYPCTLADDPSLEVLQDAIDLLAAAQKYALDAIEKKICQKLTNPKILEVEPLRCFAIAHQAGLREEAQLAAKYSLAQPLIPSWFTEINLVTATDLLALLTYHRKCGDAVYVLKADLSWVSSHYGSNQGGAWLSYRNCSCTRTSAPRYMVFGNYSLQWWEDFMEEVFAELREKPCGATVALVTAKTAQSVRARNCSICSPGITEGMRDFSDLLSKRVEEVVSQIVLDFNFSASGVRSQAWQQSVWGSQSKVVKKGKQKLR